MSKENAELIKRVLDLPNKSFLLFGPRGVGKSTLVKMKLKFSLEINLLKSTDYIALSHNPSLLIEKTKHLKKGDWVFIDEVQKIPSLLDEVHNLYETKKINFALSGSSARKLKRGGANLLAGRALQVHLFPLVYKEFREYSDIKSVVDWGSLPSIIMDKTNRIDTLATYVESYLKQELIEEGLIRKLEPFVRFLKTAGIYNAQILNVENVARESHIGRTSVDKYFDILEDTLIGFRLPAIQLGIKTREIAHPKFYFFDSGVARASAGLIYEDIDNIWRGFSFETIVLNEVKSYNNYNKKFRELYYYKVSGGEEVDLLIEITKKTLSKSQEFLALEIKYSVKWDKRWSSQLTRIMNNSKKIKKAIGIYMGSEILTHDNVLILPFSVFIERLYNGDFF